MKKRALIIEDNEKNMMLEKDLLENAGFDVLEARNGTGGIAMAKNEKPDVIVMDVRLPDMRGTQVARLLREEPATCDIPIIYVTASVLGEAMDELRIYPNTMILTKPIDTRTFSKEIDRFIKGGS